jgi:hypothetical protein
VSRHPLPGDGGTHGIEYDQYEDGIVWLITLRQDTVSKVRISDWTVLHTIPSPTVADTVSFGSRTASG